MPPYRIQATPNPNSLKFAATGEPFIESGMEAFSNAEQAGDHALGKVLFEIEGVDNVLILPAFVTVSKQPDGNWETVLPAVEKVLAEWMTG